MQVERRSSLKLRWMRSNLSGERVSMTRLTYPTVWNNSGKLELIPDPILATPEAERKGGQPSLWEGVTPHQLVGEVTAHQGNDG